MANPVSDFAPLVYLHPKEKHCPSLVEWYLQRVKLNIRNQDDPEHDYPMGDVTAELLATYWDEHWNVNEDFYLEIDRSQNGAESTKLGQPSSDNPPVYCRTIERPLGEFDPDLIDYEYWFFYPYNGTLGDVPGISKFFSDHWGDWEHVTVRTKNGDVEAVYYAAHGDGKWVTKQDAELTFSVDADGAKTKHPVVYSALDSHASYPNTGKQARDWLPDDFTDKGEYVWQTWNNVISLPSRDDLKNDEYDPALGWLRFNGRWGSTDHAGVKSPSGPAYHRQYARENPVAGYALNEHGYAAYCSLSLTDGNERNSLNFSMERPNYGDKKTLIWTLSNVGPEYLYDISWNIDNDRSGPDATVLKGVKVGSVTTNNTGTENAYIADLTYTDPKTQVKYSKNDFFTQIGVDEVWVVLRPTTKAITIEKE